MTRDFEMWKTLVALNKMKSIWVAAPVRLFADARPWLHQMGRIEMFAYMCLQKWIECEANDIYSSQKYATPYCKTYSILYFFSLVSCWVRSQCNWVMNAIRLTIHVFPFPKSIIVIDALKLCCFQLVSLLLLVVVFFFHVLGHIKMVFVRAWT